MVTESLYAARIRAFITHDGTGCELYEIILVCGYYYMGLYRSVVMIGNMLIFILCLLHITVFVT